ncbi:unnamed protein product, partial [Acanthocheilonema viteae]
LGKVPGKAVPTTPNANLKNAAVKKPESSSDSTSSSDEDAKNGLRPPVLGKVPGKAVPTTPNANLKNAAVKKPESSSDSSSNNNDTGKSLKLSVNQSTRKSLALQKGDKFKDNRSLGKTANTPARISKIIASSAGKFQTTNDLDDSSSDSESEINEASVKKVKLQVHEQMTGTIQKKAEDTSSSSSSDSDSCNAVKPARNTQKNSADILNGELNSTMKSSSKNESCREAEKKAVATKASGDKTFANEDTSSSDLNSGSEVKKMQSAALVNVKQSKKTSRQVVVQSEVKPSSSSDSSSDSETVFPKGTAQKQQSVRLEHRQEVTGKQKLVDDSFSDGTSSDDVAAKTAVTKISAVSKATIISPKHLNQKAAEKLPSNSKLSAERDSDTSSDSDSDEAASQSYTDAVQINGKYMATKDSATSSDSSSDSDVASKKRNVKATFKQANKGTSKVDDSTKETAAGQRKLTVTGSGKMDSHSLSNTLESNAKSLIAENSLGMAKAFDDSSSNGNNKRNNKRKADNTSGKTADTVKAFSSKEDKNKNRTRKNTDSKMEIKDVDVKDGSDSMQKGVDNNQNAMSKNSGKQQKKIVRNEPFRRVRRSKDELDDKFRDNSYRAKTYDQWGRKAYEDMRNVQGKGFRHEKTKKKRGSYNGSGTKIDISSHSIKFSSDSD